MRCLVKKKAMAVLVAGLMSGGLSFGASEAPLDE